MLQPYFQKKIEPKRSHVSTDTTVTGRVGAEAPPICSHLASSVTASLLDGEASEKTVSSQGFF